MNMHKTQLLNETRSYSQILLINQNTNKNVSIK